MFNGAFILQALLHPYWVPSSVPSSRNKIVSNKGTMRVVFYPGGKKRSQLESLAEMIAVLRNWIGGCLWAALAHHSSFGKLRASTCLTLTI